MPVHGPLLCFANSRNTIIFSAYLMISHVFAYPVISRVLCVFLEISCSLHSPRDLVFSALSLRSLVVWVLLEIRVFCVLLEIPCSLRSLWDLVFSAFFLGSHVLCLSPLGLQTIVLTEYGASNITKMNQCSAFRKPLGSQPALA